MVNDSPVNAPESPDITGTGRVCPQSLEYNLPVANNEYND